MKILFSFICVMLSAITHSQPNHTVDFVDINKYVGRWYDIASYPASFQRGCRCSTADYELIPGKKFLQITNRCIVFKNGRSKIRTSVGKAFPVPGTNNSRLKVQFFWPFKGDYYIIGLADDYSWAIIGHPERKYLWILSRESFMPSGTYNGILEIIHNKGYSVEKLEKTSHNCDTAQ